MQKKVLLVDDNPLLTEMYKIALEQRGAQVFVEHDGRMVVEKAEKLLPDLILLDLKMPTVDGGKVLSLLKENEKTRNIEVVIFSSIDDKAAIAEAKKLGAVDYIIKSESEPGNFADTIISDYLS